MIADASDNPPTDPRLPQVIVAGHICLDLIPQLTGPARVEPGRLVKIGPAAVSTGGAVANTGIALHRLGVPVRLMGKVGDDLFGRAILDVLRGQDPRLADAMRVATGEASSYSIVISPPNVDRSFMHCSGANDTFTADDVNYDLLSGARLFHFGYPPIMRQMYADGGRELRSMFGRVREAGLATSLDLCQPDPASEAGRLDWVQLLSGTLPFVDVFLPSIDELLYMLDRPTHDRLAGGETLNAVMNRARLAVIADQCLAMGAAVVAMKLGEHGLYVRTSTDPARVAAFCSRLGLDRMEWSGKEALSPCFRVERVVGTTGSGDCTIAGFVAALLRGDGPAQAADAATAVGACSVEAADATSGVPSWPVVAERVRRGWQRWPVTLDVGSAVQTA
ncbi:MAG TPA: carbohydrate kinase family protein [Tepidisphaeraceae bacterium]|jgi:sugar/nucleoside kinase (ribokinase family)|nr:carbohydrate kinase family protein [Tepidisphaeraceae bacterium]